MRRRITFKQDRSECVNVTTRRLTNIFSLLVLPIFLLLLLFPEKKEEGEEEEEEEKVDSLSYSWRKLRILCSAFFRRARRCFGLMLVVAP